MLEHLQATRLDHCKQTPVSQCHAQDRNGIRRSWISPFLPHPGTSGLRRLPATPTSPGGVFHQQNICTVVPLLFLRDVRKHIRKHINQASFAVRGKKMSVVPSAGGAWGHTTTPTAMTVRRLRAGKGGAKRMQPLGSAVEQCSPAIQCAILPATKLYCELGSLKGVTPMTIHAVASHGGSNTTNLALQRIQGFHEVLSPSPVLQPRACRHQSEDCLVSGVTAHDDQKRT